MELPKEIVLISYDNGLFDSARYKQFSNGTIPNWARNIRIEKPTSSEKRILDELNAEGQTSVLAGTVISETKFMQGPFSKESSIDFAPNGDPGWVVTCRIQDTEFHSYSAVITPTMTKDMAAILELKLNSDLAEFVDRSEKLR